MLLVNGKERTAEGSISDITTVAGRATAIEARQEVIHFSFAVTDAVSANKITAFPIGAIYGEGEIIRVDGHIEQALTGAGGDATINCEIDGTNVTGGVVTLAIASPTQGLALAGSAVTAGADFGAAAVLDVEIAVATAFTAGRVNLFVTILRTP